MLDRTGDRVAGRYELERLIGVGNGRTTVWQARDLELPRLVALKVCPPDDPAELDRTIHGTWIGAQLDHPNVVAVYEYGETDGGAFYCAMERLRGRTLQRLLDLRPFRVHDVLRVADQLLEGLGYVHAQGVIHRDIKTPNLFVAWSAPRVWHLKLLDFGIARHRDRAEPGDRDRSRIVGTPEYMAPEQIVAGPVDERTDLYQVGVVLFKLLTGTLPFPFPVRRELYEAHLDLAPITLSAAAPDREFPASLEAVVARLLEKAPSARFASAAEVRRALAAVARGEGKKRPLPEPTRRLARPTIDEPGDDDVALPPRRPHRSA